MVLVKATREYDILRWLSQQEHPVTFGYILDKTEGWGDNVKSNRTMLHRYLKSLSGQGFVKHGYGMYNITEKGRKKIKNIKGV